MGVKDKIRGAAINAFLGDPGTKTRRRVHAIGRVMSRAGRRVTFFHRVDDPHSQLLAQALPSFLAHHDVELELVVVPPPAADADPEPQLREAYAPRDAALVARYFDVDFPNPWEIPEASRVRRANAVLLLDRPVAEQLEAARLIGHALFSGDGESLSALVDTYGAVPGHQVRPALEANYDRLRGAGHYQGGMLAYGGEWYWGVDRLAYLEARLVGEGLPEAHPTLRRRETALPGSPALTADSARELELFYSFRSPYSYIALAAVRELCERQRVALRVRPVLPMVMRGLPVPTTKRMYIVKDAKREADRLGVPFGRICDPVGVGVERCLAVFPYADSVGKGLAFLEAAGRAVWAEAVDVARDEGLEAVVAAAGLDWAEAQLALADESWRDLAEDNRRALLEMGLWGVPTFRLGTLSTWGQDRIFALDAALSAALEHRFI